MKNLLLISNIALSFFSCEKVFMGKDIADDPQNVFDNLWKNVDEKYSFFEVKNIDWNAVKGTYQPKIQNGMSDDALFNVCADMLNELQDGHVNIISTLRTSSYKPLFLNVPENYNGRLIIDNYIGQNYKTTGPFSYGNITSGGNTFGYIYYGAFTSSFTTEQLEYVLQQFDGAKGLIIDVRNNGGGFANLVPLFISSITSESKTLYKTFAKNGKNHDDFESALEITSSPNSYNYAKPIAILTNRGSYSATTFFSTSCKPLTNIIQVGDTTGGGGGIPTGAQLPNGWNYRFSATKTQLLDGYEVELGVMPDFPIWMDATDEQNGIDSILEKALTELSK
jgi:hypothetical protein